MKILYSISYSILIVCCIYVMISCPEIAFTGASSSVHLFINIIFPSLFPFLVIIDLILQTKVLKFASLLFEPIIKPIFNLPGTAAMAIISGLLGGYPAGAIIASGLRENNQITKVQGENLIAFCNNASPIFITGAVGAGLLHSTEYGLLLLKCHILASLTVGVIFRLLINNKSFETKDSSCIYSNLTAQKDVLSISDFTASIFKSIKNMTIVGSYIIIFGMVIALFGHLKILERLFIPLDLGIKSFINLANPDISISPLIFNGLIELSNGIRLIAIEKLPLWLKLSSISLILGWGSLSVHFQVFSILRKTDIRRKIYILGKLSHGILAATYTLISFLL